ncbi:hypothetical protein FJZ21_02840 [Candidatus Pacearchaeota archaeon]|nr:hypothetical protein [Candidatus Pacearchaeota archaeon]
MISDLKNEFKSRYSKFRNTQFYQTIKKIKMLRILRQFIGWRYGIWLLSRFRLHGDRIHLALIKKVIKDYKITSIVETGTFLGYTTELFAKEFPHLQIYTAEINLDFYKKAKKSLSKYKNVHVYNATSPKFLESLIKERLLGERPFFYLDAHWLDDWPLEKELQIISRNIPSAIISIDDFKVEGDSRFIYDSYKDKECSLNLVNPNLSKNDYNLLFPDYDPKKIFGNKLLCPQLIGYTIIFQNMKAEFQILKKTKMVAENFIDKSSLIGIKTKSRAKKQI